MVDVNNSVEKKKRFIINVITWAIIIGLYYFFMVFGFQLILPFLVAFLLAAILQRPINFIVEKTKISKRITTTILLIAMFLLILGPLLLTVLKIGDSVKDFWDYLKMRLSDMPSFVAEIKIWLADVLRFLPESLERTATDFTNGFLDKLVGVVNTDVTVIESTKFNFTSIITSLVSNFKGAIWNTTKNIPMFFIGLVMSIISTCFLAFSYDDVMNFIVRQLSENKKETFLRGKSIAVSALKKMIKSYFIIYLITFCEILLALFFLKIVGVYDSAYIPITAALIAVVDILPVLGTGTILIPWGILSLITGKIGLGIGLLVAYVVILIIRQVLEPKLISHELGLNPIVTLSVMFISLRLFGFIGMMITVILISVIKILNDEDIIHLWKKKEKQEEPIKKSKGLLKKNK